MHQGWLVFDSVRHLNPAAFYLIYMITCTSIFKGKNNIYFLFLPPHATHRSKNQRKEQSPMSRYLLMPQTWKHLVLSALPSVSSRLQTTVLMGTKPNLICLGMEKFLTLFYMNGVISVSKEVSTHSCHKNWLSSDGALRTQKILKTWKQELHALSCFLIVICFLAPECATVKSVI